MDHLSLTRWRPSWALPAATARARGCRSQDGPPPLVPALLVVADERAQHAAALAEELARAAGEPRRPSLPEARPQPDCQPRRFAVGTGCHEGAARIGESATKLAATLSGYRAGLMGSIAAACTASYKVGLTPLPKKGTP